MIAIFQRRPLLRNIDDFPIFSQIESRKYAKTYMPDINWDILFYTILLCFKRFILRFYP